MRTVCLDNRIRVDPSAGKNTEKGNRWALWTSTAVGTSWKGPLGTSVIRRKGRHPEPRSQYRDNCPLIDLILLLERKVECPHSNRTLLYYLHFQKNLSYFYIQFYYFLASRNTNVTTVSRGRVLANSTVTVLFKRDVRGPKSEFQNRLNRF